MIGVSSDVAGGSELGCELPKESQISESRGAVAVKFRAKVEEFWMPGRPAFQMIPSTKGAGWDRVVARPRDPDFRTTVLPGLFGTSYYTEKAILKSIG